MNIKMVCYRSRCIHLGVKATVLYLMRICNMIKIENVEEYAMSQAIFFRYNLKRDTLTCHINSIGLFGPFRLIWGSFTMIKTSSSSDENYPKRVSRFKPRIQIVFGNSVRLCSYREWSRQNMAKLGYIPQQLQQWTLKRRPMVPTEYTTYTRNILNK